MYKPYNKPDKLPAQIRLIAHRLILLELSRLPSICCFPASLIIHLRACMSA